MENSEKVIETLEDMKSRHIKARIEGMKELTRGSFEKETTKTEKIRLTLRELYNEMSRIKELTDEFPEEQMDQRLFSIAKTQIETAVFRFADSIEIIGQLSDQDCSELLEHISIATSFLKRATRKEIIQDSYDVVLKGSEPKNSMAKFF